MLRPWVAEARRRNQAVEAACWEALELGCGVLVTLEPFSVVVHPGVPASEIYQAASVAIREAFEASMGEPGPDA